MKKSSGQIALSFLFILTSDNLFCFQNRNIRLKQQFICLALHTGFYPQQINALSDTL